MNVNGQIMVEKKMKDIREGMTMDVSRLVPGVYILTLRAGLHQAFARFIKI
jgi:hypothetical protein